MSFRGHADCFLLLPWVWFTPNSFKIYKQWKRNTVSVSWRVLLRISFKKFMWEKTIRRFYTTIIKHQKNLILCKSFFAEKRNGFHLWTPIIALYGSVCLFRVSEVKITISKQTFCVNWGHKRKLAEGAKGHTPIFQRNIVKERVQHWHTCIKLDGD